MKELNISYVNPIFFSFLIGSLVSCGIHKERLMKSEEIATEWVDHLEGDFSFQEEWSYPEGVFLNEFGQLSCDGLCSNEIENMMDENGRIYDDSLMRFYSIVDTTHRYHSLQSESNCYEYGATNYINWFVKNGINIDLVTQNNAGTHSSLCLSLTRNQTSLAEIRLQSVGNIFESLNPFPVKSGFIKIDKTLYDKGIVKAVFDLQFYDYLNPKNKLYWKGKIYLDLN